MRFIMEIFPSFSPEIGFCQPIFSISNDLLQFLTSWKEQQKYKLAKFGIISNPEQFVFTYIDTKGNINKPLHADYLNNKMKSIRKRHKELTHDTPHKLRHTGATLAKQAGMSLEAISEALTHSRYRHNSNLCQHFKCHSNGCW